MLALLAAAASTRTIAARPIPPSGVEAAAIQRAGVIGRELYDYDRAASASTDALLAQVTGEHLNAVRGWVVEPAAGGTLAVTYFSGEARPRKAVFVATVTDGKVTGSVMVREGTAKPLTLAQERLASAVATAMSQANAKGWQPCTPARFNSVALPPISAGEPVSVYLLSPQVSAGELPFGGHYRVDVAENGRVLAERAYTKACLTMPRPAANAAGVVVTHLLDPTPTEIHVFTSLAAGLPVFVGTADKRVWKVNGASVTTLTDGVAR